MNSANNSGPSADPNTFRRDDLIECSYNTALWSGLAIAVGMVGPQMALHVVRNYIRLPFELRFLASAVCTGAFPLIVAHRYKKWCVSKAEERRQEVSA